MYNYELIYLLNLELDKAEKSNADSFKYIKKAYQNVIDKLKPLRVISKQNIDNLDITEHMCNKLKMLLEMKISKQEKDKIKKELRQSQLYDNLVNIAGIGKSKAEELIKSGLTKTSQLNQKKWNLPDSVLLMIKTKPLKIIPHDFILSIEKNLIEFKQAKVILVGGFIRKKPFSKDIDVMIVSNKNSILDDYIEFLKSQFEIHVYQHGINKVSLVAQIKNTYVKVDIFRSLPEHQHSMLLYSIGSQKFNIRMRGIARQKGYLLNQYGLFKNGKKLEVKSEKDFFKILEIPYTEFYHR